MEDSTHPGQRPDSGGSNQRHPYAPYLAVLSEKEPLRKFLESDKQEPSLNALQQRVNSLENVKSKLANSQADQHGIPT